MSRHRPSLLLSGFMGTGKSTVGQIVAARAGVPFLDLDEAIMARAGHSIETIFANGGESTFRALEAEALATALATPGPLVVALGGGALLDASRRREALAKAVVITLEADAQTLAERTRDSVRPLLAGAPDRLARIRELLATRELAYAEAHARISTQKRTPEAIADEVLAAWQTPAVAVPLGLRSYTVRFAVGSPESVGAAASALKPSSTFLITDENVHPLWGSGMVEALRAHELAPREIVVLPPGEAHKNLATFEHTLRALIRARADRDALVIAHGGGVVSDIAGFAAATLLRGVRWMAVPTTLLAMVDASVGGKTGVDLGPAKNAVGAFHQPRAVFVDVAQLSTQSPRDFASGLAEVVKAACIGDPLLLALLEDEPERVLARDPILLEQIAQRAVAVKAAIVARDEHESNERALLNFGHTLGHALEAEGGYTRLTHGEAVSLGMVAMLRVGQKLGLTEPATTRRITELLARLGLPVDLDAQPLSAAFPYLAFDKKRRGGQIRAVLLREPGAPLLAAMTPEELARDLGLDLRTIQAS